MMVLKLFVSKKIVLNFYPFKKNQGQSLVEVIAATGIVLLIITGIITATNRSVKNSDFSKSQALATKYAQEGIENARSLRDQDPTAFWSKTGTENETINNGNFSFTRKITYSKITDDKMRVTAVVQWQDASGNHQTNQELILTNAKQW